MTTEHTPQASPTPSAATAEVTSADLARFGILFRLRRPGPMADDMHTPMVIPDRAMGA